MGRNRLYGIGEPVTMTSLSGHIDAMKALDLMAAVGVTSFREWMHITTILKDPVTPNPEIVAAYTRTLDRCVELDIEVTGMSHCWFLPEECKVDRSVPLGDTVIPRRDLTAGSLYMRTLEMLEQSWYTLVNLFPQVPQWEVGNEWNLPIFLRPVGWFPKPGEKNSDGAFTHDEAMHIAADMMYYSAKGIRRANPKAKVVSFSPCVHGGIPYDRGVLPPGFGISITLEKIYQIIESGESFSTNSDDYFDMLAWHPYLSTQMGYAPVQDAYPAGKEGYNCEEMPDALWKSYSDRAYHVMAKHGDGHKKVLITEYGFSDAGDEAREAYQAELIRESFRLAEQMPYVHSLHFFRLFENEGATTLSGADNKPSPQEAHFGIFKEPHHQYQPKKKAWVLQEIYGGSGDLAAIGKQP